MRNSVRAVLKLLMKYSGPVTPKSLNRRKTVSIQLKLLSLRNAEKYTRKNLYWDKKMDPLPSRELWSIFVSHAFFCCAQHIDHAAEQPPLHKCQCHSTFSDEIEEKDELPCEAQRHESYHYDPESAPCTVDGKQGCERCDGHDDIWWLSDQSKFKNTV